MTRFLALASLLPFVLLGTASAAVPLIIDTDIGGGGCQDVDDVAAVCIGNAMADNGEVELLAVVHDTHPPECVGAISVLNHYYGRDDVPIGAYKGADVQIREPHKYVTHIVTNFPSPIKNSTQVPDAVTVYRRVLATQPENSVVIASIGLLTNLAALLRSGPDEFSSLDGLTLVSRKVKLLAVMGGQYPEGSECNFCGGLGADHAAGAAASGYVFSHWPSTVRALFSGAELGKDVFSGRALPSCVPASSPCRQAFASATASTGHPDLVDPIRGRMSWDPLTVLAAVRGGEAAGCVECTDCDGRNSVDSRTGYNKWDFGARSNQSYLLLRNKDAAMVALDRLLCQLPLQSPPEPAAPPIPGTRLLNVGATEGAGPERTDFGGGDFASAWDGYASTFYDYSQSDGGWTKAALLEPSSVVAIQFFPRPGFLERCLGGEFVGILQGGATVSLAVVSRQPVEGWNTLNVSEERVLNAVEYRGPGQSYGNMAEIRVYARHDEAIPVINV